MPPLQPFGSPSAVSVSVLKSCYSRRSLIPPSLGVEDEVRKGSGLGAWPTAALPMNPALTTALVAATHDFHVHPLHHSLPTFLGMQGPGEE